jgi:hypothetical protein
VSTPDPGRVLRRALLGWGLGHLALGRTSFGIALLVAQVVAIGLVAWLTVGLADTSAYLAPFLAGIAFLVAWAWQAVAAYHAARRAGGDPSPVPDRSPALAMGWLAVPLLAWGTGFWLVGASASSPSAVLDRFVTDWTADALADEGYPPAVVEAAEIAGSSLGSGPERFRDVRLRIDEHGAQRAIAVAEAIHYERRDARFLGIFAGSELVPVADREVLLLDLAARPAELPGGGDVGAVRWELVGARVPES